jgi:hypothetical protein
MIISEKQIMQLMDNSRAYSHILMYMGGYEEDVKTISLLLRDIKNQQSDKLEENHDIQNRSKSL